MFCTVMMFTVDVHLQPPTQPCLSSSFTPSEPMNLCKWQFNETGAMQPLFGVWVTKSGNDDFMGVKCKLSRGCNRGVASLRDGGCSPPTSNAAMVIPSIYIP
ncbi:hypothetical protein HanRHA438_Chr03g0099331 [Helianthus annuus]|nr:hypothetical protein HanIR_Chr12g0612391 [Helianthus annuus]KAJ0933718.1 hypothetical protein HanRHA438_Chr03g0099331 [Helianthus annuus]